MNFKKLLSILLLIIFLLNFVLINKNVGLSFINQEKGLSDLFNGVNKLTFTGSVGVLSIGNPALPLVISSEDSNPKNQISIAGLNYKEGLLLAFSHDSFFSDSNFDYFDNKIFTKNIFNKSLKRKISISLSHGEFFNKTNSTKFINFAKLNGFEVEFIEGSINDSSLNNTGIFISGSAWIDFKDFEIKSIINFIEKGGVALILALGWSWVTYHPERKLEELPANKICSIFNIKWIDGYIVETKENIYNDATIFKIFYPDTINYLTNIDNEIKNIEDILKNNKDLNKALLASQNLRVKWINALETLYQNINLINNKKKEEIFNKLKDLIKTYPYYFKKDHSFDEKSENILTWSREKFSILFYGYAFPLDDEKKNIISDTLGLKDIYKEIWNKFEILILDNNNLYQKNLQYILSFFETLPKDLHNLKLIMTGKLLGTPQENLYLLYPNERELIYDLGASFATQTKIGYAIDLWDLKIDSPYENPFPPDITSKIDPYFSGALSHELTHIIDFNLILSDESLRSERESLLKRAGDYHLNYLRSIIEDGFFTKNPTEFIASIGNQWFCDTWNTFDLAIKRFNNGYKEPINQFLFFAKVLSMNSNLVPFYYREESGTKLVKIDIKVEKDINNRITKIFDNRNLKNYEFILDNEGAVKEIIVKEQNVENESFLIITSKKVEDSKILDNFISYKKAKGFMVYITNVEDIEKDYSGIDLPEKIRNYLKQDYQTYKIKYLLLIGDPYNSKYQTTKSTGGSIPMRYCYPNPQNHIRSNDTNTDGSVPTDYYYADLTSDWDSDKDGYFGEYQQDNVDFENELIVGRIPFDDINTIKEILDRSIEFENKNLIKDSKKVLMAGGMLTYGENNCGRVDTAKLFENIWNDFLKNRNFERVTLYEKDGIEPSIFKPDLSLNRDNLINELSTDNFDIVSIFTYGGYIDSIRRRIWNKDDGDKIPENDEFLWLDLINKEDENLIFPTFSKSIYLIHSFWPSCIDWPDFDSISELLFKRCAVALIGNVRHYCLICGWNSLEDGTSLSIIYKILDNLSNSKTIGESLYNSLNYYSKNFIYEWWYCKWLNLFSFASLFGDPTLSLYSKFIPPSKVEEISLELTSNNYVLINWSTSIQGSLKIKGYHLYRGEDSENFSLIATLNLETNRYLDEDVKSGKIYYYYVKAFDELGNESDPSNIVTITIPIKDNSPPTLEIDSPKDMEMINKNSILIVGKTYDDISGIKKLLINDYEINISQTGVFSFNVSLVEGMNQIKIISIDNSDNKTEKILTITVDTKPPILNLSIPNEVDNKNLTIKGTVYDEGLSGIKNNSITINGKSLIVLDGNINYIIELSEGLNNIVIVVEDNAGNKTSKTYIVKYIKKIIIILQIGNYNCFVNDNKIEMDTSPKIIQGRTYLPIRYIITPLGGEISWDSIEKKTTILFKEKIIELWIGKNYARINGEIKLIDPDNPNVVPIIIEGRTMLPIRFVAENLGCKVDWDGATKTITITYPAD